MAIERANLPCAVSRRWINKRLAAILLVPTVSFLNACSGSTNERRPVWQSSPDLPFPPNEFIDKRFLKDPRNLDVLLALLKNFPTVNVHFATADSGQIAPDSAAAAFSQALDQHRLKHILFARTPKYRLAIEIALAGEAQFSQSYYQFNTPMPIFMLEASENTALAHQPLNYVILDQKTESPNAQGTVTKVEKLTRLNVLFAGRFDSYLAKDLAVLINHGLLPNQPPSAFLFPFRFHLTI